MGKVEEQMDLVDSGPDSISENIVASLAVAKKISEYQRAWSCVCSGYSHGHYGRWMAVEGSEF